MNTLMYLTAAATDVLAQVNPGTESMPGLERFNQPLGWVLSVIGVVAVVGIFVTAARMMVASRRGDGGGEAVGQLGWICFGCVLALVGSQIVNALFGFGA